MYHYWKAEVPKDICEGIITELTVEDNLIQGTTGGLYTENAENEDGTIGGLNLEKRNSRLTFVDKEHPINSVLLEYIQRANIATYGYQITKMTPCQFARYDEGEYYHWHTDAGFALEEFQQETRKLSLILQLSDPDTYEGGEVQFFNGEAEIEELPIKPQGSIMVFDSRMWHRVTTVTKGVRYSIVSWILGPAFK